MKKRNPQGKRWRRLDNTGKLFGLIANEKFGNVFRVSVVLKEQVDPELLQQALDTVLPQFKGFKVKLKRGFFWYYFEENKRQACVEPELDWPCRYIDPKSNELYLFRVSFYQTRINLEIFHALTDGMGAVNFLKELTCCYLRLKRGVSGKQEGGFCADGDRQGIPEDSYLKNYRKMPKRKYSFHPAYRLKGPGLPLGETSVIHGYAKVSDLKGVCRSRNVSMTKYLTACLIWAIFEEQMGGKPGKRPISINLPINLRAFFDSSTTSNFFAVTAIEYGTEALKEGRDHFEDILEAVSRQMDENIVKEKLEEIISYNVSNEKKWYIRITPLFVKWLVLGMIFRQHDKAQTTTLSNIGLLSVDSEYRDEIEKFQMMIGVSGRQPFKCGVCAYGDILTISFTSVLWDSRIQDRFFERLRQDGIEVETESNGPVRPEADRGHYPLPYYSKDKWKKLRLAFYGVLAAIAVVLAVVNVATFSGLWWSGIAGFGILYAWLTLRYSILRHANLGKSLMIQTIGMGALLVIIDWVLGFQGWSVNYAVPALILFADAAVVFLMIVNRMNWQSYFMYEIAITVFSFIPLILWALGFVTRPFLTIITVMITVMVLITTIWGGKRRFRSELARRFHF